MTPSYVGGNSILEFLADFSTVTLEQVQAVMAEADCLANRKELC